MTTTGFGLYPFSQNQPQRHNVFVSYHHDNDQWYRDKFESLFAVNYNKIIELESNNLVRDEQDYLNWFSYENENPYNNSDIMVSKSVQMGSIPSNISTEATRQEIRDKYLRNSTVTVVLIGRDTWKRKFVDWEISMSIRQTKNNSRSGLLGIILPNTIYQSSSEHVLSDDGQVWYNPHTTIPPRLYDNVKCGFAKIYKWSEDPFTVKQWIHEAFLRRDKYPRPDNSRKRFAHNRSGDRWY